MITASVNMARLLESMPPNCTSPIAAVLAPPSGTGLVGRNVIQFDLASPLFDGISDPTESNVSYVIGAKLQQCNSSTPSFVFSNGQHLLSVDGPLPAHVVISGGSIQWEGQKLDRLIYPPGISSPLGARMALIFDRLKVGFSQISLEGLPENGNNPAWAGVQEAISSALKGWMSDNLNRTIIAYGFSNGGELIDPSVVHPAHLIVAHTKQTSEV